MDLVTKKTVKDLSLKTSRSSIFQDLLGSSKLLIIIPFQHQLHLPQREARQRNGGLQDFAGLVARGQVQRQLQGTRDGVHQLPQEVSFILRKQVVIGGLTLLLPVITGIITLS